MKYSIKLEDDFTHLNGGIRDDDTWQGWWHDLVVMPSRLYEAPSVVVPDAAMKLSEIIFQLN